MRTPLFSEDSPSRPLPRPSAQVINLPASHGVRAELQAGLSAPQASISPKFLYDEMGSRLFDAICLLPEYYVTRSEAKIFARNLDQIAASLGPDVCLIEPGAGNCRKAAQMFARLAPRQYVALDISAQYLQEAVQQLRQSHPQVEIFAVGMDFSAEFDLPPQVQDEKRVFFYPGSSIGNFDPEQAVALLQRMRSACGEDGGLLIGVDLIKSRALLDAAYADALGLTAAFNLNMLRNVNHHLDADFDLADWEHKAFFNRDLQRVEMHLQARQALLVQWPGGSRRFERGETIHTENSYKYTVPDFDKLLSRAGFESKQVWQDEDGWFALIHARAV